MTFRAFTSIAIMVSLIICMLLQLLVSATSENIVSTLIIALATSLTISYLYWIDAYSKTPISALVLLGLLFSGLLGALLVQTLYWNAVTKYLYNPVFTFSHTAFYLLIALCSHYIYLSLFRNKHRSAIAIDGLLAKIGLYNIPSAKTVWLLSLIGIFAVILGKLLPNATGRAIFNLNFLMWFPFFIIFYIYKFGDTYANPSRQYTFVSMFFGLIIIMGIAFNTRGLIVSGLVNLFLVVTIILLDSKQKHSFKFYAKISCLLVVLFGLLKPFSTFSDAMLLARSERGEVTPIQMLANTFDLYVNSTSTELVRNNKYYEDKYIENKIYSNYDEDYIENGILTRFILTKFHDNAFHYASNLSASGKQEISEHVKTKAISILPQPFLDALNIDINKMENMNSTTDILVHETTGRRLGGLKVASTFADIEVITGVYATIVFMGMSLIFFFFVDLYSNITKDNGLLIAFPFFALASKYILFQLPVYGLQGIVSFIIRDFLVDVLIFCFLISVFNFAFPHFRKHTKV